MHLLRNLNRLPDLGIIVVLIWYKSHKLEKIKHYLLIVLVA